MAESEAPAIQAGIVMAGYFAGQLTGALAMERWLNTVGHVRTYAACAALLSAATLAHPFGFDVTYWSVLRFTQGFCFAGVLMCVESWLNSSATKKTRGKVLASYMIVFYGAYAGSQLLLNVPDVTGFGLYVIASILISVAAIPIALTRTETPQTLDQPTMPLTQLYKISPTGIVGAFMAGIILGAYYGLAAFYGQQIGLSLGEISVFLTVVTLGGLLMQWPIGHLSDLMDRRRVIVGVNVCLAFAALSVGLVGASSLSMLLILGALFGGLTFTLYPLCVANANDRIESENTIAMTRGLIIAYSAGAIVGPAIGAAIMGITTPGLFFFVSAVALSTSLFVIARMRVAEAVPEDLREDFQVLPRTTPVVTELDPRGEYG